VLSQLAHDSSVMVQHAVASHPALTSQDAEQLAQIAGVSSALLNLAKRKNLTDRAVQHIAGHLERYFAAHPAPPVHNPVTDSKPNMPNIWATRAAQALASNPHLSTTSIQTVLDFAQSYPRIRRLVIRDLTSVHHPHMTPGQQRQLVTLINSHYQGDWSYSSQWQQPLPPDGIAQLVHRYHISPLLRNRALTWDQASKLATPGPHANDELAALLTRPDCSAEFMRQNLNCEGQPAYNLVEHPQTPPDVMEQMSRHGDPQVRSRVARRTRNPQVLQTLAQDINKSVRREVASNRRTPLNTLEQLLSDPETRIRAAAAQNPNLPRAARAMWQLAVGS